MEIGGSLTYNNPPHNFFLNDLLKECFWGVEVEPVKELLHLTSWLVRPGPGFWCKVRWIIILYSGADYANLNPIFMFIDAYYIVVRIMLPLILYLCLVMSTIVARIMPLLRIPMPNPTLMVLKVSGELCFFNFKSKKFI